MVHNVSQGERWTYDAWPLPAWQPLLLVGDVSVDAGQCEWCMGAVLATLEGEVLWEAMAWMHLQGASTTVLEATILHEVARAVLEIGEARDAWPTLHRFADSRAAIVRLQHRPMASACVDLPQRVEVAEELHVVENGAVG